MKKFLFANLPDLLRSKVLQLCVPAALAVLSISAFSAELAVATRDKDYIVLTDSTCTVPIALQRIGSEYLPRAKQAHALIEGHKFEACWVQEGDTVGLMFDDGDVAMIPAAAFKEITKV